MKSICVYCGSNAGSKPVYTERAMALGDRIARDGMRLVYGGGNVGLMGIVADAVLEAGGDVVGVILRDIAVCGLAPRDIRIELTEEAALHAAVKIRSLSLSKSLIPYASGSACPMIRSRPKQCASAMSSGLVSLPVFTEKNVRTRGWRWRLPTMRWAGD